MACRLLVQSHYPNQGRLLITAKRKNLNETIIETKQFLLTKLRLNVIICNFAAILYHGS